MFAALALARGAGQSFALERRPARPGATDGKRRCVTRSFGAMPGSNLVGVCNSDDQRD